MRSIKKLGKLANRHIDLNLQFNKKKLEIITSEDINDLGSVNLPRLTLGSEGQDGQVRAADHRKETYGSRPV
jgi:hypothetical protein